MCDYIEWSGTTELRKWVEHYKEQGNDDFAARWRAVQHVVANPTPQEKLTDDVIEELREFCKSRKMGATLKNLCEAKIPQI